MAPHGPPPNTLAADEQFLRKDKIAAQFMPVPQLPLVSRKPRKVGRNGMEAAPGDFSNAKNRN